MKVLEMLSAFDPGSALSQQQEHSESRHEPTVPNAPVASKMLGHSLFEKGHPNFFSIGVCNHGFKGTVTPLSAGN